MAGLTEIEKMTKDYSEARRMLAEKVQMLEDDMAIAKKRHLPGIKKTLEVVGERHTRLKAAIEEAPELFVKPRTITFHGIRIGFMKDKGELAWEDTAQVVKLIKRHYPDSYEAYIKVMETPVKSALAQLSVAELRKLGVTVTETGDEVIIKSTDSEIDKLVNALLKDEETKEAKEAA